MIRESKLHPQRWTRTTWVSVLIITGALGLTGCIPSIDERRDEWTECGREVGTLVVEEADPATTTEEELKALIIRAMNEACGEYPS